MTARTKRGKAAERRGRWSERLAAIWLMLKGYRILGRRVKTKAGEIDLIAKSPSGVICFIEVKARSGETLAAEAVMGRQRGRIVRASTLWLGRRSVETRFDMVTIVPGRLPHHVKDAWRPDDL